MWVWLVPCTPQYFPSVCLYADPVTKSPHTSSALGSFIIKDFFLNYYVQLYYAVQYHCMCHHYDICNSSRKNSSKPPFVLLVNYLSSNLVIQDSVLSTRHCQRVLFLLSIRFYIVLVSGCLCFPGSRIKKVRIPFYSLHCMLVSKGWWMPKHFSTAGLSPHKNKNDENM